MVISGSAAGDVGGREDAKSGATPNAEELWSARGVETIWNVKLVVTALIRDTQWTLPFAASSAAAISRALSKRSSQDGAMARATMLSSQSGTLGRERRGWRSTRPATRRANVSAVVPAS